VTRQLEIRVAQPDDAAAIAVVLYESFVEYKALYTNEGFAATTPRKEQIEARMGEGPVWVASWNGVMVGTVSAVAAGGSVYIRGMAVLPAARGSGAGSALLKQVESWAASGGTTRIFLSTTPFLESAIHLYEKFGFQRTKDGPFDLFGTPLITMEKSLSR
jgi:ribosomal protein S18 acetylase RimI-like enzyme